MFDFQSYNRFFLSSPQNLADNYGVRVISKDTDKTYWKCIGVYHLKSSENVGKHNVFIEILDKDGNRITHPYGFAGFTWEGKRPEERVNPVLLDKPANEPAGNIDVYWGQRISVWIIGRTLGNEILSDVVENLHTMHPDEGPGNTLGHHSFYVVFQETDGNSTPDPTPIPEPIPNEEFELRLKALENKLSALILELQNIMKS